MQCGNVKLTHVYELSHVLISLTSMDAEYDPAVAGDQLLIEDAVPGGVAGAKRKRAAGAHAHPDRGIVDEDDDHGDGSDRLSPAAARMAYARVHIRKRPAGVYRRPAGLTDELALCTTRPPPWVRVPPQAMHLLGSELVDRKAQSDLWCILPYVQSALMQDRQCGSSDDDFAKIVKHFLCPKTFHGSTAVALAHTLAVDRLKIPKSLHVSANLLVHADRAVRQSVTKGLVHYCKKPHCLCEIEFEIGDEATMVLNVQGANEEMKSKEPRRLESEAVQLVGAYKHSGSNLKPTTPSKILEAQDTYAMLVRCPRTGELVSFRGECASWCQLLDRTTAECLMEAARHRSGRTDHSSSAFLFKVKGTCLDQAKSNKRWRRNEKLALADKGVQICSSTT